MILPGISVSATVPFHDVDSLGIVWHGHYYKYFELARTELYRSKDFDIEAMHKLGYVFPVIESQCRYIQPLKYAQVIEISASFKAWEHYIRIAYTILDATTNERCAYGHTKQAICRSDGKMLLEVPASVIDVLNV